MSGGECHGQDGERDALSRNVNISCEFVQNSTTLHRIVFSRLLVSNIIALEFSINLLPLFPERLIQK